MTLTLGMTWQQHNKLFVGEMLEMGGEWASTRVREDPQTWPVHTEFGWAPYPLRLTHSSKPSPLFVAASLRMYLTAFPISATQSGPAVFKIPIGLLKQSIKVIKKGESVRWEPKVERHAYRNELRRSRWFCILSCPSDIHFQWSSQIVYTKDLPTLQREVPEPRSLIF